MNTFYPFTTSSRQLDSKRMNEIIKEAVPYEERMRFTYLPIIVMDTACNIGDDVLKMLANLKMEGTKQFSRVLKQHIKEYRNENRIAMKSALYERLSYFTNELYIALTRDLTIYQYQYQQALLSNGISLTPEECMMVSYSGIIKRLVYYVMECDRKYSELVSKRLKGAYTFRTQDCAHCLAIGREINELYASMNIPELKSDNIDLAFRIFKNKVERITY